MRLLTARTRTAAALAVTAVGALVLAACSGGSGGSGTSSGGPTTITFWSSSEQPEIDYLVSHFNSTHTDVQVKGQYIASADESTAKQVAAIKSNSEKYLLKDSYRIDHMICVRKSIKNLNKNILKLILERKNRRTIKFIKELIKIDLNKNHKLKGLKKKQNDCKQKENLIKDDYKRKDMDMECMEKLVN